MFNIILEFILLTFKNLIMELTRFNNNWNNKLNCNCFTTIRLSNQRKYAVNSLHQIWLKNENLYTCIVLGYREFYLHELNDFMAFVDTGLSRLEVKALMHNMYPNVNFQSKKMCIVLFGRHPTRHNDISSMPVTYQFMR